jgi:hypothetical protein
MNNHARTQVQQAVHDSREVNVVLHSLEEMQQMGMMGGGREGGVSSVQGCVCVCVCVCVVYE